MSSAAIENHANPLMTLSSVHRNFARELDRLHRETLALQTTLTPSLATGQSDNPALFELQALDAHAQVLGDLSRIAHAMAYGAASGRIDQGALLETEILASTAKSIFEHPGAPSDSNPTPGDLTLL